jgi:hypothetical protein
MIIKEAKYKKVKVSQLTCVQDAIIGCDECREEIKDTPTELQITVFSNQSENSKDLCFCSWDCVLSYLPKIKTDYFITLPYVRFDDKNGKRGAKHLIKLLSGIKLKKRK